MASAKRCDRCNKYYEGLQHAKSISGSSVIGIKIITSSSCYNEYDLCEDCIKDLYKFMNLDSKK